MEGDFGVCWREKSFGIRVCDGGDFRVRRGVFFIRSSVMREMEKGFEIRVFLKKYGKRGMKVLKYKISL